MSLLELLTDDQIAILGCAIALLFAFGLMAVTGAVRQSLDRQRATQPLVREPRKKLVTSPRRAA